MPNQRLRQERGFREQPFRSDQGWDHRSGVGGGTGMLIHRSLGANAP